MRPCTHGRRGIVTNQPGQYDPSRSHASTVVCDRVACIEAAQSWVASKTNETAVFILDADRQRA